MVGAGHARRRCGRLLWLFAAVVEAERIGKEVRLRGSLPLLATAEKHVEQASAETLPGTKMRDAAACRRPQASRGAACAKKANSVRNAYSTQRNDYALKRSLLQFCSP